MKIRIEVDKTIRVWIEELLPGNPADPEEHYLWEIGPDLVSLNTSIIAQNMEDYPDIYKEACNAVIAHITGIIKTKIEKELKLLQEAREI